VFDESIFPFSTTTTPASTSELDLSSVFPTDPVVEPPLTVFPTGPATSPVARDTSGPLPCPGPTGSPSGPALAPDASPGSAPPTPAPPARFAQPVRVYQRRAPGVGPESASSTPAPLARFAQPVRVYQRRARLAPLPPAAPVAPSSPGHLRHRRRLPRRRDRPRHRGTQLPGSPRRCTTLCSFTDTRVMFTRW